MLGWSWDAKMKVAPAFPARRVLHIFACERQHGKPSAHAFVPLTSHEVGDGKRSRSSGLPWTAGLRMNPLLNQKLKIDPSWQGITRFAGRGYQ